MRVDVAGLGQQIPIGPFPPPEEPSLTPEQQERALEIGLVIVIVAGTVALLVDALLKKRSKR
jgi:hypothetical protein